jgi:hypothetical protein
MIQPFVISNLKFVIILLFLSAFCSCKKNSDPTPVNPTPTVPIDTSFSVYYSATELPKSTAFNSGINLGALSDNTLHELSGIGASYVTQGAFWTEQDSGNENKIYLFDKAGGKLGSAKLPVANRDWEDLSTGPGPTAGVNYIYLAEIGDNKSQYPIKYIYRFPEPTFLAGTTSVTLTAVDIITFHFPDGTKNAETLMVDPLTKDIYVVSKEDSGATIYVAKYPQELNKDFAMIKVGKLPISTITSGDISPDGKEVVLKDYGQIFYWKKTGNETISQLLKKTPVKLPYNGEPKGEAICFGADGSGYYTTSEVVDSTPAAITFYKRK